MSNRAVFLDRDGTVIREVGYLYRPEQVEVLPGIPAALKKLKDKGLRLVIVSNQSGVARGKFGIEDVEAANARMRELLLEKGVKFDAVYYCPHLEGCSCRKPAGGMIERAAKDMDIDPKRSYVVGDRLSDIGLARTVGAAGIMVLTGYGTEALKESEESDIKPDHVAADLAEAAAWILEKEGSK